MAAEDIADSVPGRGARIGFVGVSVLGPVAIVGDGHVRAVTGERLATVASLLFARAGAWVRVEELIDAAWGDHPPRTATTSLRNLMSRVRRTLEGVGDELVIESAPAVGYRIVGPRRHFDHLCLLDAGETSTQQQIEAVLQLWRGEPFGGADLVALLPLAQQLRQHRDHLSQLLAERRLADGNHAGAIAVATPLVEADPSRELLVGTLMRALYASGRQPEALRVYERSRTYLREELGLDPTPELAAVQYSILAHEVAPPNPDAPAGDSSPALLAGPDAAESGFIGRSSELRALRRLLVGSSTRSILVAGEAGSGKSEIIRRLAREATSTEGELIVGWANPYNGEPFGGLRQLFARSWPAAAEPERHEIEQLLRDDTAGAAREGAALRSRLVGACAALARRLASAGIRVIVALDDAHYLDEDSASVVAALIREANPSLVFVLATRHTASTSWMTRFLGSGDTELLRLDPLALPEATALLSAVVPDATPDEVDMLALPLMEASGGSPLAIKTIAAALLERLRGEASGDLSTDLPAAFTHAIAARLAMLDERERHWLSCAAVLGSPLRLQEVEHLSGEKFEPAGLARFMDAGLLCGDPVRGMVFEHDLIRQAVLTQATPGRRAALEAEAGRTVIKFDPTAPARALAHFLAAGDHCTRAELLECASSAGALAAQCGAMSQAVSSYGVVIDRAGRVDHDEVPLLADAHAGRGRALLQLGRRREGFDDLIAAVDLHLSIGRHAEAAELAIDVAVRNAMIDSADRVGELLHRATHLVPHDDVDDIRLRCEALTLRSGSIGVGDAEETALVELLAAAAVDPAVGVHAARAEMAVASSHPVASHREIVAVRTVRASEEHGGAPARAAWVSGMGNWASALASTGRVADAERVLQVLEARVGRAEATGAQWFVRVARADLAQTSGALDEGLRRYDEALAFGLEHGVPDAEASWTAHVGVTAWLRGNARVLLPAARELAARDPYRAPIVEAFVALVSDARDPTASEAVVAALAQLRVAPRNPLTGLTLTVLGHAAASSGPEIAEEVHQMLLPWQGQIPRLAAFGTTLGPSDRVLARLADARGRTDEARSLLDRAIRLAIDSGARPWLAWCLHDLYRLRGDDIHRRERDRLAAELGLRCFDDDVVGRV